MSNLPLLEIRNLTRSFGTKFILKGLSLTLEKNKLYGLIGPSEGGKSTLLKAVDGVITPSGGEIINRARATSLMFQEGALFDSLTVLENVAFPLLKGNSRVDQLDANSANSPSDRRQICDRVGAILDRVGLAWAYNKVPSQLSGGMRRRVSLARALISGPDLMLLDDPTSGLDPVASSVIMDLIVEVRRELMATTLIASHDLRRLLPAVDEVIALFDGRIQFFGKLQAIERDFSGNEDMRELVKRFIGCRYDFKSTVEI